MGKKEKEIEVTINVDELCADAKKVAIQQKTSVTKILAINNFNSGVLAQSKDRYLRVFGRLEIESEPNLSLGMMRVDRYNKICDIFGLDANKYLVTAKEENAVEEVPVALNADALQAELQTMREAIQDIGKIATQSMMYLKRLCEIWDKEV